MLRSKSGDCSSNISKREPGKMQLPAGPPSSCATVLHVWHFQVWTFVLCNDLSQELQKSVALRTSGSTFRSRTCLHRSGQPRSKLQGLKDT